MDEPAQWLWVGILGAGLSISAVLELAGKKSLSTVAGEHPLVVLAFGLHFIGRQIPLIRRLSRFDPLSALGHRLSARAPSRTT